MSHSSPRRCMVGHIEMDVHNCPGCIAATMERSDTRSTQSPRKESWLRLCAKSPKVELRVLRCEQQLMEKPGALTACSPGPTTKSRGSKRNSAETPATRLPNQKRIGGRVINVFVCVPCTSRFIFFVCILTPHIPARGCATSILECVLDIVPVNVCIYKKACIHAYLRSADRQDRQDRKTGRQTNKRTDRRIDKLCGWTDG